MVLMVKRNNIVGRNVPSYFLLRKVISTILEKNIILYTMPKLIFSITTPEDQHKNSFQRKTKAIFGFKQSEDTPKHLWLLFPNSENTLLHSNWCTGPAWLVLTRVNNQRFKISSLVLKTHSNSFTIRTCFSIWPKISGEEKQYSCKECHKLLSVAKSHK